MATFRSPANGGKVKYVFLVVEKQGEREDCVITIVKPNFQVVENRKVNNCRPMLKNGKSACRRF